MAPVCKNTNCEPDKDDFLLHFLHSDIKNQPSKQNFERGSLCDNDDDYTFMEVFSIWNLWLHRFGKVIATPYVLHFKEYCNNRNYCEIWLWFTVLHHACPSQMHLFGIGCIRIMCCVSWSSNFQHLLPWPLPGNAKSMVG